jgi:alkylated DNA repair dioxygenase AlkB
MADPSPAVVFSSVCSKLVEHKMTADTIQQQDRFLKELSEQFIDQVSETRDRRKVMCTMDFFSNVAKGHFQGDTCIAAKPASTACMALIDTANEICGSTVTGPAGFNAVLVSRFADGASATRPRKFDAHFCDRRAGVLVMSHGVTRKFRVKTQAAGKRIAKDCPANHGYALQMRGSFQQEFTHEIVSDKKVKDLRISFTFFKHDAVIDHDLFTQYQTKVAAEKQRELGLKMAEELIEKRRRDREAKEAGEQAIWSDLDTARALQDEEGDSSAPTAAPAAKKAKPERGGGKSTIDDVLQHLIATDKRPDDTEGESESQA